MQDRSYRNRGNLLHRTAGPYILGSQRLSREWGKISKISRAAQRTSATAKELIFCCFDAAERRSAQEA